MGTNWHVGNRLIIINVLTIWRPKCYISSSKEEHGVGLVSGHVATRLQRVKRKSILHCGTVHSQSASAERRCRQWTGPNWTQPSGATQRFCNRKSTRPLSVPPVLPSLIDTLCYFSYWQWHRPTSCLPCRTITYYGSTSTHEYVNSRLQTVIQKGRRRIYHPRRPPRGYHYSLVVFWLFSGVCLWVCLSVCLSVRAPLPKKTGFTYQHQRWWQ